MWGFPIQTDKNLEHNRPDIPVFDNKSQRCPLIDPSCPFDTHIEKKEEEKCMNYSALKYKIAKIWKMRKVKVILVVKRALGTVTKHFEKQIQKLDLDLTIEASQLCLLGTASGYGMKKKNLQYLNLRKLVGVPYYGIFYQ